MLYILEVLVNLILKCLIVFEGSKLEGLSDTNSCCSLNESVYPFEVAIFASHSIELLIEFIDQIIGVTFNLEPLHVFSSFFHSFLLHFAEEALKLLICENLIVSPVSGFLLEVLVES